VCAVKSPKIVKTPADAAAPKPIVIRNPYLDADPALQAQRLGRSKLRIDRAPGAAGPAATILGIRRG
jgi:hypothetical protein